MRGPSPGLPVTAGLGVWNDDGARKRIARDSLMRNKIKELNKLAIVTFVTARSVDLRKNRNKFFHKVVKQVGDVMKFVWIAFFALTLGGCFGPQYATDDGVCREQARQKIRTYAECRQMLAEGHRMTGLYALRDLQFQQMQSMQLNLGNRMIRMR